MSIGSLNLTVTSPVQSFTEPLTLPEVRARLRLSDGEATDDDDEIENILIPAARDWAENLQGRDLVVKQWDKYLDYFCEDTIELRDGMTSVDLVKYRDSDGNYTTLVEGMDYIVDTSKRPGIIMPAYGTCWPSFTPWPSGAVLIRFTSGIAATDAFWNDSGKRLKKGMLDLIAAWYEKTLPFTVWSAQAVLEYPYSVTASLGFGAVPRVR